MYSGPTVLKRTHRYEGLVDYMAANYVKAAEIGIGHFPDVALALIERGLQVFATDILPFRYRGLRVIMDDVTVPDIAEYASADLIYSLRPPPELIPYMVWLAGHLSADLIIKPLSSEHPGGQLRSQGNTYFFLWSPS